MQEEDDEWGAFGGGADRSITAEPTDPPRDVPTAHGDGVEGPSVTPVVGDQSVQDDADFADFEAAPAAPAAVDDDDEFGDFAEQPPEPTAVTQPGPGPVDGGDEDEFGDFASFDEAPAPPSPPPPTPPVSVAVGSARDLAALRGDDFTAGCSEALRVAFPHVPGREEAHVEYEDMNVDAGMSLSDAVTRAAGARGGTEAGYATLMAACVGGEMRGVPVAMPAGPPPPPEEVVAPEVAPAADMFQGMSLEDAPHPPDPEPEPEPSLSQSPYKRRWLILRASRPLRRHRWGRACSVGWRLLSPLARRLKISLTLQPPPRSQSQSL